MYIQTGKEIDRERDKNVAYRIFDKKKVVCFLQHKADKLLTCPIKRHYKNGLILQPDGSFSCVCMCVCIYVCVRKAYPTDRLLEES